MPSDQVQHVTEPAPQQDSERVLAELARVATDKKATSAVALAVGEYLVIVDWFVVVSAPNRRQVRTLVEEVEKALSRLGVAVLGKEGLDAAEWVLLDCGDVVVHVMTDECRDFYSLERLWAGVHSRDLMSEVPAGAGPGRRTGQPEEGLSRGIAQVVTNEAD